MVAATGAAAAAAAVRVEDDERDILRAPRVIDSRLTRGDGCSGLGCIDDAGEDTLSGISSGAGDRWWPPAAVAGGLKSTQT